MPSLLAPCTTTKGWVNSKTFSTYTAIHSLVLLVAMFSVMADANVTRTSVVPLCDRKPYSKSLNCDLAIFNALLSTMLSMVLETQLSNEMGLNALRLSSLRIGTCSACFQVLGKRPSLYNLLTKASTICLAFGPVWCSILLCTPSDPGTDFLLTCNTMFNSCIVKSWSCIKSVFSRAFATMFSLIGARLFSSLSTISGKWSLLVLPANSVASNSCCAIGFNHGLPWCVKYMAWGPPVTTKPDGEAGGFCGDRRPEGHVFHTSRQAMIKTYYSTSIRKTMVQNCSYFTQIRSTTTAIDDSNRRRNKLGLGCSREATAPQFWFLNYFFFD